MHTCMKFYNIKVICLKTHGETSEINQARRNYEQVTKVRFFHDSFAHYAKHVCNAGCWEQRLRGASQFRGGLHRICCSLQPTSNWYKLTLPVSGLATKDVTAIRITEILETLNRLLRSLKVNLYFCLAGDFLLFNFSRSTGSHATPVALDVTQLANIFEIVENYSRAWRRDFANRVYTFTMYNGTFFWPIESI